DAAGSVSAVGGRGQAQNQQARVRVAEAGDRPPPVRPIRIHRSLVPGHSLPMRYEAGAEPAVDDLFGHLGEAVSQRIPPHLASWTGQYARFCPQAGYHYLSPTWPQPASARVNISLEWQLGCTPDKQAYTEL